MMYKRPSDSSDYRKCGSISSHSACAEAAVPMQFLQSLQSIHIVHAPSAHDFECIIVSGVSYLKNNGLVVLLEVEGKDVSEHECGAALA